VKAIPTRYEGVEFRSRLEARWAAIVEGPYGPEMVSSDTSELKSAWREAGNRVQWQGRRACK